MRIEFITKRPEAIWVQKIFKRKFSDEHLPNHAPSYVTLAKLCKICQAWHFIEIVSLYENNFIFNSPLKYTTLRDFSWHGEVETKIIANNMEVICGCYRIKIHLLIGILFHHPSKINTLIGKRHYIFEKSMLLLLINLVIKLTYAMIIPFTS